MPTWRYTAIDADGRDQNGTLEADTPRHARALLRERSLTALGVEEVAGRERAASQFRRGLSGDDLALVIRQLATLVRAAIPVEQALAAVAEQAESPRAREVVQAVRARVLEGHSLADALGEFPHIFPEVQRATVAAGEQAGHLDIVLERLADHTETQLVRRGTVATALYYPGFLVLVAIGVVALLMTKVVPTIVARFERCESALPLITRVLISVSSFFAEWWWLVLAAIVLGVVLARAALTKPALRHAWQLKQLRWPVFGRVLRASNAEQFARTLSILTASSVPVLDALRVAAATLSNLPMREAVLEAAARVREGAAISRALAASGLFPPLTIQLIASGEATGTLDEMLQRAADHLEREVDTTLRRAQALLGPVILVGMALLVGTIMAAVLLPLIQMNQQLSC